MVGEQNKAVMTGAAQGSILGPYLQNVCYDSPLRTEISQKSVLAGYANKVAVLIEATIGQ